MWGFAHVVLWVHLGQFQVGMWLMCITNLRLRTGHRADLRLLQV